MSDLDKIIFGKKKFSDLLKEIYDNQKTKKDQIYSLISELKPLVQEIGDATLVVPLIKDYLEIGVKNDEQLVKMATVIQRLFQSTPSGENEVGGLSDSEREQLMSDIKKLSEDKDKNE